MHKNCLFWYVMDTLEGFYSCLFWKYPQFYSVHDNNIVDTHSTHHPRWWQSALDGNMTSKHGEITLILGPMFSGKTSELIRLIRRYTCAKRRCVVIKYSKDNRYSDDCAASHNQDMIPAIATEHLTSVEAAVESYDVIGVDEGQFISLISMMMFALVV